MSVVEQLRWHPIPQGLQHVTDIDMEEVIEAAAKIHSAPAGRG